MHENLQITVGTSELLGQLLYNDSSMFTCNSLPDQNLYTVSGLKPRAFKSPLSSPYAGARQRRIPISPKKKEHIHIMINRKLPIPRELWAILRPTY